MYEFARTRRGHDRVQAICLSVLGIAVTPVDRKGTPLYNSITAVDGRTTSQANQLRDRMGAQRIYNMTGIPVNPTFSLSKIMWLREHEPEIFSSAWKFLLYEELLIHRFGLIPAIDYCCAGFTMAFDSKRKVWSKEMLEAADIDPSRLADPVPSGTIIGEISGTVAVELGLPRKTKIITGGHDQVMSALGAGMVSGNTSTDCFGTIECVVSALPEFRSDPLLLKNNQIICCHVIDGMFATLVFNFTAGALLRWYRDTLGWEESRQAEMTGTDVYDLIIESAPDEPSSVLVLPHFIGSGTPYLDAESKGAFVGMTLATRKHDIVKGILDSITYELRLNLEALESAGITVHALHAFGGGAKSQKLLQLKADITGKPITVMKVTEAGCLGGAMLAGTALGVYDSVQEAASVLVRAGRTFYPRDDHRGRYDECYHTYQELYPSLRNIHRRLSGGPEPGRR